MAALSFLCCVRLSLVVVHELLIVEAPLVAEHELQGEWGSEVVVHRLSWPMACIIFLD